MTQNFKRTIWAGFLKVHGPTFSVVSFVLTFVLWGFAAKTRVPLFWLLTTLVILIFVTSVLVAAICESLASSRLPRVLNGRWHQGVPFCLLEPSELFSIGSLVSCYVTDESGFEKFVAVGKVDNIQSNGQIQVSLLTFIPGQEEYATKFAANDPAVLRAARIKPAVPHGYRVEGYKTDAEA